MSKRQSRSAVFVGRFWGLGKTQEDGSKGRERLLSHVDRWLALIEHDTTRLEKLLPRLRGLLSAVQRERDPGRWSKLAAEASELHEEAEKLAGRIMVTYRKTNDVARTLQLAQQPSPNPLLLQDINNAGKAITRVLPVGGLPELRPPLLSHPLREKPSLSQAGEMSSFGAALQRAIATADARKSDT